jgi:hypothetical protein
LNAYSAYCCAQKKTCKRNNVLITKETYFNSHDHYLVEQVCDHAVDV